MMLRCTSATRTRRLTWLAAVIGEVVDHFLALADEAGVSRRASSASAAVATAPSSTMPPSTECEVTSPSGTTPLQLFGQRDRLCATATVELSRTFSFSSTA